MTQPVQCVCWPHGGYTLQSTPTRVGVDGTISNSVWVSLYVNITIN